MSAPKGATRSHVLPNSPNTAKAPPWPFGTPSPAERALWRDLWRNPVSVLWRAKHTPDAVVGRYVAVLCDNPASPALVAMESALGLTPASLDRMGVTFEDPRPRLADDAEDVLSKARARRQASA